MNLSQDNIQILIIFVKLMKLKLYTHLLILFDPFFIHRILGIEKLTLLRSVFLHENLIAKMEGFDTLRELIH